MRVNGLLLESILFLSSSTTQRRLVKSCSHPVSKIQQSGRLSLDAHSPDEEEGICADQLPRADACTGIATSASPLWSVAASSCLRIKVAARSARLANAAAPLGTGGGRTKHIHGAHCVKYASWPWGCATFVVGIALRDGDPPHHLLLPSEGEAGRDPEFLLLS